MLTLPTDLLDLVSLAPEAAVDKLVGHALDLGASDLFLSPGAEHTRIRVRHLGVVRTISAVSHEHGRRIAAHLKNVSGADVNERRRPGDGRLVFRERGTGGREAELRLAFLPTLHGEDLAARILPRTGALHELDALGMTARQLQTYRRALASPAGLVLITGPTGSGKTATLYASLLHLHDGRRKINTIEDPVEHALDGLHQSAANPAIGLGFAELLRGVLRQNPDVLMLGEVRDEETAQTAVRAAHSGVLVFATLHAPDTAGAVAALRGLGVPAHALAGCLRCVVSQRLVRTLDARSRVAFDLGEGAETFAEVRDALADDEGRQLWAPGLTEANGMTGYTGQAGVFELMEATRAVRALIASGATGDELRQQALSDGMQPFRHGALLKIARGQTCAEEVFRVIPSEHLIAA